MDAPTRRQDVAIRQLRSNFNDWYLRAYRLARQSILDRYAEEEIEEVRMGDTSELRRPLTNITPGQPATVNSYCRERIRQIIRPHPDPPGQAAVNTVWNRVILGHWS